MVLKVPPVCLADRQSDIGDSEVNPEFLNRIKESIDRNDPVLLYLDRAEASEIKNSANGEIPTHYLLVSGYQQSTVRRQSVFKLTVVDPMEGDDEHEAELVVVQSLEKKKKNSSNNNKKSSEIFVEVRLKKGGKDKYGNFWAYFYDRRLVGATDFHFAFCDVCRVLIKV